MYIYFLYNNIKTTKGVYNLKVFEVKLNGSAYEILAEDENSPFEFEGLTVKKDGEETTDFGYFWSGTKVGADDMIASLIHAYVLGDKDVTFSYVCPAIEKLKSGIEYKYNVPTVFPKDENNDLPLEAVTKDGKAYYSNGDYFVMAKDGKIVTDMENFFTEGLIADKDNLVFATDECKEWISELEE